MRRTAIIMAVLAVMLQGCVPGVLTGDAATGDAQTIGGADGAAATVRADPLMPAMVDAAEPLDAVATAAAGADAPGPQPKPRPDAVTQVATEAPPPAAAPVVDTPKSSAQIKCEKRGDRWQAISQDAGHTCVRKTRDDGKSCSRESQCDGQCLARSKTCAPFDPLWGCNDVLQEDGRRVTLCLN
jgi:hypothetical protein